MVRKPVGALRLAHHRRLRRLDRSASADGSSIFAWLTIAATLRWCAPAPSSESTASAPRSIAAAIFSFGGAGFSSAHEAVGPSLSVGGGPKDAVDVGERPDGHKAHLLVLWQLGILGVAQILRVAV